MDCRTARENLEAARLQTDDMDESHFAAAVAHLQICTECAAVLHSRQQLDRRVGRLMRDIPVPVDLKERLIRAIAMAELCPAADRFAHREPDFTFSASRGPTAAPGRPPRMLYGGLLRRGLAAAAVCLLIGVAIWLALWVQLGPSVTLTQLQEEVPLDFASLPNFDGSFDAQPPDDWLSSPRFRFDREAMGWAPRGERGHVAALYRFRFQMRRDVSYGGVLLVIPTRSVAAPISAQVFDAGGVRYFSSSQGSYAAVAWTAGEMTYVCFVSGGDAANAIEQALHVPPA